MNKYKLENADKHDNMTLYYNKPVITNVDVLRSVVRTGTVYIYYMYAYLSLAWRPLWRNG